MNRSHRLLPAFLLAAALAALFLTAARADDTGNATIKFSDPAKPGTLRVTVANGDVRIHGADTAEISVHTDIKPQHSAPRKDGLRVLTTSSSYMLTEKSNVVTLAYGLDSWPGAGGGEFDITVPRSTSVVVTNSLGGDVTVGDITGSIEVKSLNGEVKLTDVAGGALVETMNGEINCSVRELHEGKAIAFTSMNGEVRLHLPLDLKANIRLRTHNGSILTDFDDKQLVTKTASLVASDRHSTKYLSAGDAAMIRKEVNHAVRIGMEAAREAARAARDAVRDAKNGVDKSDSDDNDDEAVPAPLPMPAVPPVPPLPPMTGGKIVTGTLNGGGPEISIATMNGDITLRKTAGTAPVDHPSTITLAVADDGSISLNGKQVADEELPGLLEKTHRENGDAKVFIKANETTQPKRVGFVMDACRKAGLNKFSLQSR